MENTEIKLAEFYENTDKWENRELGADEEFASLANEADDDELMSLLNEPEDENIDSKMQLISIRLPQTLIADLKKIGKSEDLGYQTLAREVLKRFVKSVLDALRNRRVLVAGANVAGGAKPACSAANACCTTGNSAMARGVGCRP